MLGLSQQVDSFLLAVLLKLASVGMKVWSSGGSLLPRIPIVPLSMGVLLMTHDCARDTGMGDIRLI